MKTRNKIQMISDKMNKLMESFQFKIFIILLVLAVSSIVLFSLFGVHPYPYVHADIDSVYIFSSMSLLTGHAIEHNDHPGMILHLIGILPVVFGTALIVLGWGNNMGGALIQNLIEQKKAGGEPVAILQETMIHGVVENMPIFQQLFLALAALLFLGVLVILLRTLYKNKTQERSIVFVLGGLALMLPPTLGDAIGFNADFCAFPLAILFAVSLLWKRDFKNDLLTPLFFILAVYTKVTFAPLGLLMLTAEKKSLPGLFKWTLVWSVIISFLFWDLNRFLDFAGFMVSLMISGGASSGSVSVMDTFLMIFTESPLQSFYIALFMVFGVLLAMKKEYRITGMTGLIVIISVIIISFLRPYKAAIYMWPVYSAGLLLVHAFIESHPRRSGLLGIMFAILIIMSGAAILNDTIQLKQDRTAKLEFHAEYVKTLNQFQADCLMESENIFFKLGDAHWLANAFAKSEYSHYLEKLYEDRFGLKNMHRLLTQGDGYGDIEKYFQKGAVSNPDWLPRSGCYLSIQAGREEAILKKFPGMDIRPVKTIKAAGEPVVTVLNLTHKIIK